MEFQSCDLETAPEQSKKLLGKINDKFTFIPNFYAKIAISPAAIEAYEQITAALNKTAFSMVEQQVVALSASVDNNCTYCVAAHSMMSTMLKMPAEVLEALREGKDLPDSKLQALSQFTKLILEKRGFVSEKEIEDFLKVGYSQQHVLDLLTIITLKTLSNYVNHVTKPELDQAFSPFKWEK